MGMVLNVKRVDFELLVLDVVTACYLFGQHVTRHIKPGQKVGHIMPFASMDYSSQFDHWYRFAMSCEALLGFHWQKS